MTTSTTSTPRTNQARHTAFNGQKTDYDAYVHMANHAETLERELAEKTNEVARLRHFLETAIEIAEFLVEGYEPLNDGEEIRLIKSVEELDKLKNKL